jgi:hypothetical protein
VHGIDNRSGGFLHLNQAKRSAIEPGAHSSVTTTRNNSGDAISSISPASRERHAAGRRSRMLRRLHIQ